MTYQRRSRQPEQPAAPSEESTAADACESSAYIGQLRARRGASQRLPVRDCGRSDPWHFEPPATGYEDACMHLLGHGLTPAPNREGLRLMWRRDGHSRRAAQFIARAWELAA